MQSTNIEEKKALINDILSVFKDAEKASLRAIKAFAPYINEKGRPLPFLCKTADDFSMPTNADEYQVFLRNLDKRLYPSYFTPKMNFNKAVSEICNCITSGNYVADDYVQFAIVQYENDSSNKRFAEILTTSINKMNARPDFTSITRTRGESSYYAYQIYFTLNKKIGLRSPAAANKE